MKKLFLLLLISIFSFNCFSQTWIWNPGDYEIWLANEMNNRRTDRGTFFPPFWKSDSHYVTVEFSNKFNLKESEVIKIAVEGKYNVKIDGKMLFGMPSAVNLSAGEHKINIKVWNQSTPPAIFVNGKTVKSDSSWNVTNEDKEWIDASGKVSDTSATTYEKAGSLNFNTIDNKPSEFVLSRKRFKSVSSEAIKDGKLYDFGKETFGYISLENLSGNGNINVYYGESREEALDKDYCETLDKLSLKNSNVTDLSENRTYKVSNKDFTLKDSKAFRYVYIVADDSVKYDGLNMDYEYLPEKRCGSFSCNDKEVNKIWEVGKYTLQLTTREFFIDGIKRDRWIWSGDAIQSYLMNYYLCFDCPTVKRTIWALRGKDPVTSHINTIMDYSFYWINSIYDYYMYTGDSLFVAQIYPRMKTMMDYILSRTDENGMVEGLSGDWVFVDWADGYMDKKGELSFEQMLFCRSLETMDFCSKLLNKKDGSYSKLAENLRNKINPAFWNKTKEAYVHNRINGKQSDAITRYSNIFAVLYGYADKARTEEIKKNVLFNDSIMSITTPYMRFYELEALCSSGEQKKVMGEIKSYWGGMLKDGATSFWEKYNPGYNEKKQISMYGRPYGKSLCHAWGASPIYLLGRYFLGVEPVKEGYKEYSIKPNLGGLKWIKGDVLIPDGKIFVAMDKNTIKVKADSGEGYLYFTSCIKPKSDKGEVVSLGGYNYKIKIDSGNELIVTYR